MENCNDKLVILLLTYTINIMAFGVNGITNLDSIGGHQ